MAQPFETEILHLNSSSHISPVLLSSSPTMLSQILSLSASAITSAASSSESPLRFLHGEDGLGSTNSAFVSDGIPARKPETDSIITNPFIMALSITASVGNLLMVALILCTIKFRKPANLLIANLSLSCFLFVLSSNLRQLENEYEFWTYSTPVCQTLAVLHRIPIPVIALTTMTISLDRGRIARNPIPGSNLLSPLGKIIVIWIFSVIILIPLGFSRKLDNCSEMVYKCTKVVLFGSQSASLSYGIIYLLSVHIVPAMILIKESVMTLNKMKFLHISGVLHQQRMFPMFSDNRLRLLRNSCIFSLIFLIVWLPYGMFQFPMDLPREVIPEILETYIKFHFKFFRNFTYIQIALNPVILFVLSYDMRNHCPQISCPWSI